MNCLSQPSEQLVGNFDTRLRDEIESGTMSFLLKFLPGTDALKQLEKAKQEKVDLIKLMITGGVLFYRDSTNVFWT